MRCLAVALAVAVLAAAGSGHAAAPARCPHDAALGSVTFVRGGHAYELPLATCVAHAVATPAPGRTALRSRQGTVAAIVVTKPRAGVGAQTIMVGGKPILRVREDYRRVAGGLPGPLGLVDWSPDGRWLLYFIDPMGSASLAADGLRLLALNVATHKTVPVGETLLYSDYHTWCGSTLVLTAGGDRLATHTKHLVAARPPAWRRRVVWNAPGRAFGSVTCAPDGQSVAVLSQQDRVDFNFFDTRWQLWDVSLDGSHRLLDRPPAGFADESPAWSPDGRSLLFVRERRGRGTLMLRHGTSLFGPLAPLGYSLGYYGHHRWLIGWTT